MATLQCTSCGATYHTAATGPHLALSPLLYGCESCGSREPLHIGVTSVSAQEVEARESGAATDPSYAAPRDSRAPGPA
jgi:predicted  nucleic acid-binding Zn-ribbon protein